MKDVNNIYPRVHGSSACHLVLLLVLCLVATTVTPIVGANEASSATKPLFFSYLSKPTSASEKTSEGESGKIFEISLDPRILEQNPDTLRIELPNGELFEAVRIRMTQPRLDQISWSGELRRLNPDTSHDSRVMANSRVYLLSAEDQISGLIYAGADTFRITPQWTGGYRLTWLEQESTPLCGVKERSKVFIPPAMPRELPPPKDFTTGSVTKIDVMALYTADFLATAEEEQKARRFILDSLDLANNAFVNSQVDVVYNLVYSGPLTGHQPPLDSIGASRDWLNEEPEEIRILRDSYGADMVALFVPLGGDFCGIANLPLGGDVLPNGTPLAQRAFSVHRIDCGMTDLTFAHELGHNYGMNHARGEIDPTEFPQFLDNPILPYAFGHQFEYQFNDQHSEVQIPVATIMACRPNEEEDITDGGDNDITDGGDNDITDGGDDDITGEICNRIHQFSDPTRTFPETIPEALQIPIGLDGSEPSNNSEVARQRAPIVSAYRASVTDAAPIVQITAPGRDSDIRAGDPLLFTATAIDAEDGDLTPFIEWRSSVEGLLGTGSPLQAAFVTTGGHFITARVIDSQGKAAEWSVPIEVSWEPDAYEPDNNQYRTRNFSLGSTEVGHDFHKPRDKDWVQIEINSPGTVHFTTLNRGPRSVPRLALHSNPPDFPEHQYQIDSALNSLNIDLEAGTYFLRVFSNDFDIHSVGTEYDLHISLELEQQTEEPWHENYNDDDSLLTNKAWNFAMGYHFTPRVDGQVTALGGFFNGTKVVKLFNKGTGALLTQATVSAANDWGYTTVAPVSVSKDTTYTVAVYLAGSGGSRRNVTSQFPQKYSGIQIDGSTRVYTGSNANARPTNLFTTVMYGQADIRFQPLGNPPPVARFTSACNGLQCSLDGQSSSDDDDEGITNYHWTFPDNSTATGATPSFFFPKYGSHPVTLKVTDAEGAIDTTTLTVSLGSEPTITPDNGQWYNPNRSGNGIDLFVNGTGAYTMYWYTYKSNGTPIWYVSGTGSKNRSTWSQPLYLVTKSGSSVSLTDAGEVKLVFSDPSTAWFSWTLNGQDGGERFSFLFGGSGRTGAWDAGSARGVEVKEQGDIILATVPFYVNGQPRWVQGQASVSSNAYIPMLWYTGPGLCPSCGGNTPPASQAAGSIRLKIASGSSVTGTLTTTIDAPGSGGTWFQTDGPISRLTQ